MTRYVGLAAMLVALPTAAQDIEFSGYADFRLVQPADEQSWIEGGLGKTRYGGGDVEARIGEIVGEAHVQATPALMGFVSLRYEDTQRTGIDILEGYLRYRPVSTSPLRWSVRAGAFFPLVSLENDEVGWTSGWTLTPSAINTWVGEELRTIGAEWSLRRSLGPRVRQREVRFIAATYYGNDPAGALLSWRGWALHRRQRSWARS